MHGLVYSFTPGVPVCETAITITIASREELREERLTVDSTAIEQVRECHD